jgi:hypothetical protein
LNNDNPILHIIVAQSAKAGPSPIEIFVPEWNPGIPLNTFKAKLLPSTNSYIFTMKMAGTFTILQV